MEQAPASEGTSKRDEEGGSRGTGPLDLPTRRVHRPMTRSGPITIGAAGPSTSVQASTDALITEEMGRVRVMSRVLMLVVGIGMLLVPFLGGDESARQILIFGLVLSMMASVQLHRVASSRSRYEIDQAGAMAMVLSITLGTAVNFYGVFSPVAMIGSLGLYIACLGSSTGWSVALFAVIAGGHAVLASTILLGLRADPGLITADTLSRVDRSVLTMCVLAIYVMAFVAGRAARTSLVKTVEHLEGAVRAITERDAQLNEAKRELERAAWVGGEGRFSQQQVGNFKLGNIIGRGGMGEVYEAEHVETGTEAAVKLLGRGAFADPQVVARFAREAKTAASLVSEHAVRVLEVSGEEAAVPYLAMERLRGEDLGSLLRREKRLSRSDTLQMLQQVGAALDAARRAGIVHRDLKPQNIFLARGDSAPVWKVLDFGVSKVLGQASLTRDQLVGTPEYMAPEQARGDDTDHRADLYALAAVAYRCLTGRAPFSGKDLATVVYRVVHDKPTAPSELARIGPDVEAVLTIGLARGRESRFQSGKEMARALEDALGGELSDGLVVRARELQREEPWRTALSDRG